MSSTAISASRNCLTFNTWRTSQQLKPKAVIRNFRILNLDQKQLAHQRPKSSRETGELICGQLTRSYQSFKAMDSPPDVFLGQVDRFRGVTVDGKNQNVDTAQFQTKLQKSLEFWRSNKNRAIWFHVYKEQADWVPILAANGFDFHHACTGVVAMYRWLPTDEESNLPNYAHTLLGVGGLVINDQDEILVVSDRFAMIPNSWKLPGGYVEPRENLVDAAIREVEEETGIKTEFRSVVCLRHAHGGNFGCSDIYVVIGLKPNNLDFKRCEREIAKLQWMPVQEYLQHPQVHETNRHFVRTYLDYQKRGLVLTCRSDVHQVLKKEYRLYYVDQQEQQQTKE
ncbi:uncharacterized protein Dwil_GK17180 [Drosophila willistoni]|uniref:Nudix hydrolase domain-containing protein n=1 Tax=Drosophila willistoni TaxID=7260 RepID=B4NQ41_DROWI|nr:nucleoside diphosphate-linked moiety X motif 6 [Drosophila willistoni]EDW86266.1 uncharacterized protein Dwil_GK17180 [Drosophila willistoni]